MQARRAVGVRRDRTGIVRDLQGVGATADPVRPDGRVPDGSIRHILLVAYLYPPSNVVSAHRPAGLRRAFESAGIRTTVLTSEISGSYPDDGAQRIIRAGDLRTRFRTQYQTLVGYRDGPLEARGKPRRWANYIAPDPTAASWFPQALAHLLKLIRSDRPDVIITTSGPESSHLVGLVASALGFPGSPTTGRLARDVRHPVPLRVIDRALERQVARRSTIVTAVNDAIAADVARRHRVRAFRFPTGSTGQFSPTRRTRDRPSTRRASRSSTPGCSRSTSAEQPVVNRGRDAQTFLDALTLLLAKDPAFATLLELVIAGPISDSEREVLTRGGLRNMVRVLGLLPRAAHSGFSRPRTVSC